MLSDHYHQSSIGGYYDKITGMMITSTSGTLGHHHSSMLQSTTSTEQVSGENSSDLTGRRPRPVFFWSNGEVMKWLKRCCEEYYELYGDKFLDNEITGRSLIRINADTLKRMGVDNGKHRDEITRIILKLKLKSDMIEIKDLERKIQQQRQSPQTLISTTTNINDKTKKWYASFVFTLFAL